MWIAKRRVVISPPWRGRPCPFSTDKDGGGLPNGARSKDSRATIKQGRRFMRSAVVVGARSVCSANNRLFPYRRFLCAFLINRCLCEWMFGVSGA